MDIVVGMIIGIRNTGACKAPIVDGSYPSFNKQRNSASDQIMPCVIPVGELLGVK